MHRIDTNGHVGNLFNEGDPAVPRLPTQVDKHIMNALQEEIAGSVEAAGITLVKGTNNQLAKTIGLLGGSGGARTLTGKLTLTEPSSGSIADPILAVNAYDAGATKAATFQGAPDVNEGVVTVTHNGTNVGAAVKATNAGTGPAVHAIAGSTGVAISAVANTTGAAVAATGGTTGAGVLGTAGSGASTALKGVTANNANVAAVHAQTGHTTQALFAEKTAGDGGTEAAVYAKSTGYGLIAETTGSVRAPLRLVGLAAAPSSAQNGDLYYDTVTNKFRGYVAGVWTDLH